MIKEQIKKMIIVHIIFVVFAEKQKLGKKWYCRNFHTWYASSAEENMWYCPKCKCITREKRLSDDDTGPK